MSSPGWALASRAANRLTKLRSRAFANAAADVPMTSDDRASAKLPRKMSCMSIGTLY